MFTMNSFLRLYVICLALTALSMSCKSMQVQEPVWVRDPYAQYNRAMYLAAVGFGSNRDSAEKAALANLTAIFGQSIASETRTNYSYSQAVKASSNSWEQKSDIAQAVKVSTAMDTLIGAETKDVWKSTDGTWYASAVMDRAKTSLIYMELIEQNLRTISGLTNLTAAQRQSLDGFINYYKAASLADANLVFATVRNVISPGSMAGETIKTGNDYRLEASDIARNIPIAVQVQDDRQDRIKTAFSATLARAGFRTGGTNSRYVLNAQLILEEINYQNNPYKWSRYIVNASLTDTSNNTVVFPFNINDREGAVSLPDAESRAVRAAEEKINTGYLEALGEFLSLKTK